MANATLEDLLADLDPATKQRVVSTMQAGLAMQALLSDPEAARAVNTVADAVAKKRNPAHQTIDDVAKPYVERALQLVDQRLAERDKKAQDEAASQALADKIARLKAEDGFTDEGIQGILKVMQERGVADFDIAAREYRREHPTGSDLPSRMTDRMYWNVDRQMGAGSEKAFFFPEDGTPSVTENPEMWEREQALKYLSGEISLPT